MKPIKLKIKTKTQKYSIIIGSNLINNFNRIIKKNSINFNKCLCLIDKKVPKKLIYSIKKSLKNKQIYFKYFKANEKNKSQKTVNQILEILLNKNFSRKDCLISIGGGITGDVGAFSASIFKRGLQFINVPTTLLSQVDSSIGGKTGINSKYGKNLIGSFYQPKIVLSDMIFLKSLPKREIICGYGEILKHSLIADKNFYNFLNKNFLDILKIKSPVIEKTIFKSCKIKKNFVEKDENERNLRKTLNFGHTFGHAFEATLGFSKKLNHGEAVILGINTALNFSLFEKLLNKRDHISVINHIRKFKLPFSLKNYFTPKDIKKIIFFMNKDKKNITEKINLILLKKIGHTLIDKTYNQKNLEIFLNKELSNK